MSCIFHISFYILCLSNFPSWVLLWLLTQFIDTQIKPVVESTKQIMKISVNNYEWHELFPRGEFLFSPACCHYANLVKAFFFLISTASNIFLQSSTMLVQFLLFGLPLSWWEFLFWRLLSPLPKDFAVLVSFNF